MAEQLTAEVAAFLLQTRGAAMANDEHVALLKQGVGAWNGWREENPDIDPDLFKADLNGTNLRGSNLSRANLRGAYLRGANLGGRTHMEWDPKAGNLSRTGLSETDLMGADLSGADLTGADLGGADLRFTNLSRADLSDANLMEADVCGVDLSGANLSRANLREADFKGAKLIGANLTEATLYKTDLSAADLSGGADLGEANLTDASLTGANLSRANISRADLTAATLVEADLTGADLTGCRIYGVSAWELKLAGAKQQNLVVTRGDEPAITVDNIEVAQFVYLLLHNQKIREVIDTIGKKGVLLLGRFTEGRIEVLERLRDKLRDLGYLPMVFNFDKPETKDFTETARLLCSLSKFVVVDITNPRSAPLELQATVPDYMVPFVPILQQGEEPFSMFVDLQNKYDWVLKPVRLYSSVDRLIEALEDKVVRPAEAKFNELLARRTEQLRVENV
jgi:uncharacterized protein YjbI with pentapeptide repeats